MARLLDVFRQFLVLGCSSFGGPVAHLGYFRERFVKRENWLSDDAYADLIALAGLLPGPSSSQVGIGIGLMQAGLWGGFAAWLGFTLPSAVLMILAAALLTTNPEWIAAPWLQGLKVAAVAVVAQAVVGMQRRLAPDPQRASVMVGSAVLVLLVQTSWVQVLALVAGALAGLSWLAPLQAGAVPQAMLQVPERRSIAVLLLALFVLMVLALPWLGASARPVVIQQLSSFLRAGALAFGGGHVVLPLLEQSLVPPGWLRIDQFLAGYGLAQSVPGPMFSFSAFLGFDLQNGLHGVSGALLALMALFTPAFLLLGGVLPFWSDLGRLRSMRRALQGINAAVVGILLAALFQPLWQVSIRGVADFCLALVAFLLLMGWKQPAWRVVIGCALVGAVLLPA